MFSPKTRTFFRLFRAEFIFALACSLAIAYGSLLPFEFRDQTLQGAFLEFFERTHIDYREFVRSDILINLVLYIPVGFFWMGFFRKKFSFVTSLFASLFISMLLSFSMELVQAWQHERICSAFDLLINTLGAIHGIVCRQVLSIVLNVLGRRKMLHGVNPVPLRRKSRERLWQCAITLYLVLLALIFLRPFELVPSIAMVRDSLTHLFDLPFIELQRRSYVVALFLIIKKIALFFPLGVLLVLGIYTSPATARSRTRSLLLTSIAMFFFALLIELGQGFLLSRFPASSDVVLYLLGTAIGAYVASRVFVRLRLSGANRYHWMYS